MFHVYADELTGESPEYLTLIEYMPAYLRASHVAARNTGSWPANGSVRVYVIGTITDAELDADWAADLPDGAEVLAELPEDAMRGIEVDP